MLLCTSGTATALDGVTVVLSEEGGAYAQIADKLRNSLAQNSNTAKLSVRIVVLQSFKGGEVSRSDPEQLLVAVGTSAMQFIAASNPAQPVMNVLVPRAAFEKTARQGGRLGDSRHFSAIYLDQPWARQFALIRHVLPARTRIGILLGPDSDELAASLRVAAKKTGLDATIAIVSDETDLMPSVKHLVSECEAILAIPDPAIYNRGTIQSILLTAYRQQIPLFGFLPSYVKAGALAAVYSESEQIGQQLAETIMRLPAERPSLPPPQTPKYFSVATNQQVARSLGIHLDDEASLLNKLKRSPDPEP
ncbi:MAG: ABC transporter substrate-binding protein [Betaproteobacteria bacterium]